MSLSAQKIDLDAIRQAAGEQVFQRGQSYYYQGRVRILSIEANEALFDVWGTYLYQVRISWRDNTLAGGCSCKFADQRLICKHQVAAAFVLREYLMVHGPVTWQKRLAELIEQTPSKSRRLEPGYYLFFSLQREADGEWKLYPYSLTGKRLLESSSAKELPDRVGILTLLEKEPELVTEVRRVDKRLSGSNCLNADAGSVSLANALLRDQDKENRFNYSYHYRPKPPEIDDYLPLLSRIEAPLFSGDYYNPMQSRLHLRNGEGELKLSIQRLDQGVNLHAEIVFPDGRRPLESWEAFVVANPPLWVLCDEELYQVKTTSNPDLAAYFIENPILYIPPEEETEFLEKYLIPLAESINLEGETLRWEDVDLEPVKRLYLSEDGGKLYAELRFGYGGIDVPYEVNYPLESVHRKPGEWVLLRVRRKNVLEESVCSSISCAEFGLKRGQQPGWFELRSRVQPVDFLMRNVPRLTKAGFEIFGEEKLSSVRVNRNRPTISINVSSGIDWFDVNAVISFGELDVPLKEIRRILRKNARYVKLADGTIGEIPEDWLERYKHLLALGQENEAGLRFSNHHLTLIDQLLGEADHKGVDAEFQRRRKRLMSFDGIDRQAIPSGFRGELRPYQKAGYEWLYFLYEYGFGGCLADDMGLGKTVQVLVFLLALRQRFPDSAADLIVLPRSLLVNWQREASRFTPGLKILEYFGNERSDLLVEFGNHDLVVTTYGVMLRDIQKLRRYKFNYVVLDESQAIKNPTAQTSKAARLLKCQHRLVLTGTPVENSTLELWSQFAFLNPGLLGNLEYFKREFGKPMEKDRDEASAQFLRKMVYPFILRRTKAQVAPELPPRSERIVYSDMEPAQRRLYNRTRDYYRGMLMGLLEEDGLESSRMKILEGLLRLRQISNHPLLVDSHYRGSSAKMELLLETLETLQSEGHKALVFSQFVEMLKLIRKELEARKIPYEYLDGRTRDRQERVDRFQSAVETPFFLISLKAGGVGLNLTAADYVIHVDPWWNPAVELQATDRTHRIGQDKPVFVYKLIARDSVEEKILQLQEQKRELVDQLITTESSFFKSIRPEDIARLFG